MNYLNKLNFTDEDVWTLASLLKKGGGIHIKKKNKGSFTKYCKGEVTNACIQRAKKSGNVKLIKKAVFAENARKWQKKK